MNKKILPILIASAMLVLSACGEKGPSQLESLSISNKAELQEAWIAGDADRTLALDSEPEINVVSELNAGNLVVTSSDVAVANVVGRVILPVAEGTATITVSYLEKVWDTVDVTISAVPELDLNVAKALQVISGLDGTKNEITTLVYTITGIVTEITAAYDTGYKNLSFKIADVASAPASEQLLVFRLSATAEEAAKILVGATVKVSGKLQKYGVTPEVTQGGTLISAVGGTPVGPVEPDDFTADLLLDFSTDYSLPTSTVMVNTTFTVGGIDYGFVNGKVGEKYVDNVKAGIEYLMIYNAGTPPGAFWNETAFPASISRIRVTTGSSASATAVYSLTVGGAVITGSQPQASATEAYVIGTGASYIFDCSAVAGATFFNFSAFTKNCQIAKLEVEFVVA